MANSKGTTEVRDIVFILLLLVVYTEKGIGLNFQGTLVAIQYSYRYFHSKQSYRYRVKILLQRRMAWPFCHDFVPSCAPRQQEEGFNSSKM